MLMNNNGPVHPGHQSHLRDHLKAMILTGNLHAAVLGQLADGCPVPPAKQAWALGALLTLQGAALQKAGVAAERAGALHADPVTAVLPNMQQALTPLMRDPHDLPWASRTVAAAFIHWVCPPPPIMVTPETLEDAWYLAADILPYARYHTSDRDLVHSWPEVDQDRWALTAYNWYNVQYDMEQEAFQATAEYLSIRLGGETLHWIASEGARRELHKKCRNVCARHAR